MLTLYNTEFKDVVFAYLDALKPEYQKEVIQKVNDNFPMSSGQAYLTIPIDKDLMVYTVCLIGLPVPRELNIDNDYSHYKAVYAKFNSPDNLYFKQPIEVNNRSVTPEDIACYWDELVSLHGMVIMKNYLREAVHEWVSLSKKNFE